MQSYIWERLLVANLLPARLHPAREWPPAAWAEGLARASACVLVALLSEPAAWPQVVPSPGPSRGNPYEREPHTVTVINGVRRTDNSFACRVLLLLKASGTGDRVLRKILRRSWDA